MDLKLLQSAEAASEFCIGYGFWVLITIARSSTIFMYSAYKFHKMNAQWKGYVFLHVYTSYFDCILCWGSILIIEWI